MFFKNKPDAMSENLIQIDYESTVNKDDTYYNETQEQLSVFKNSTSRQLSSEDVIKVINTGFGSIYNILQYCGLGTYLIIGPTDSGKSSCIESMFKCSQLFSEEYGIKPLTWETVYLLSSTTELTKDFEWASEVLVPAKPTEQNFDKLIKNRELEMKEGADRMNEIFKEFGKDRFMTPSDWAVENPMAVIIDDFMGDMNTVKNTSPVTKVVSKARKLGIYLFLLAQGAKQCGKVIRDNIRCIFTFSLTADRTQDLNKELHGHVNDKLLKQLVQWTNKKYHCVMYVRNWLLSDVKYGGGIPPPGPLLLPPFPLFKQKALMTRQEQDEQEEEEENEEEEEENENGDHPFRVSLMKETETEEVSNSDAEKEDKEALEEEQEISDSEIDEVRKRQEERMMKRRMRKKRKYNDDKKDVFQEEIEEIEDTDKPIPKNSEFFNKFSRPKL